MDEATDATVVASAAPAGTLRWYPPLPLWKLYLLVILTAGFALPFWSYRTAREIRDHHAPAVKPWLYPFSFLISLIAAIASARQARYLREIAGTRRVVDACRPGLVGGLVFLLMAGLTLSSRFDSIKAILVLLFALPAPWLLMQHQLNRIKADFPDGVAWVSTPQRYNSAQWVGLITGGVLWALVGVALVDELSVPDGEMVYSGQAVVGSHGDFRIIAPAAGWRRVPAGTIGDEDSALELYGRDRDTWAVAYVHDGGSLNDVVAARRELVGTDMKSLETAEKRMFLDGTLYPASYASYEGDDLFGSRQNWRVTTVAADDRVVELMVVTTDGAAPDAEVQALAESLSLIETKSSAAGAGASR